MATLRRIFRFLRLFKKAPRPGYNKEVLYAGWVNTPPLPPKKERS